MARKLKSSDHETDAGPPGRNPEAGPDEIRWREEMLRNPIDGLMRMRVHKLLGVSLWEGVDDVVARARSLFGAITPNVATGAVVPPLDGFKDALEICLLLTSLGRSDGRADLERMAQALHTGLTAVHERQRGYDEPFFRARHRSPRDPRESLTILRVKSMAVIAYDTLLSFELESTEAARQVAEVINRNQLLPPKRNGKSVVGKSILNWKARIRVSEHAGVPALQLIPEAYELWNQGQRNAAQRAVLGALTLFAKAVLRTEAAH